MRERDQCAEGNDARRRWQPALFSLKAEPQALFVVSHRSLSYAAATRRGVNRRCGVHWCGMGWERVP